MAVRAAKVTVGTTPTALSVLSSGPTTVAIKNNSGAAIYVGGDDVDTTNGFPVEDGETYSHDLGPTETLYGVAAVAADVHRIGGVGR